MVVDSREINRSDINLSHPDLGEITYRLTTVRLWDNSDDDFCSRFNIQMKLDNNYAKKFINEDCLDGGNWTVIAHSDHNPNGGHNIRDSEDQKNLHLDIHPSESSKNYNNTHTRICGGNPPDTNKKAIKVVEDYIRGNSTKILNTYLDWFEDCEPKK